MCDFEEGDTCIFEPVFTGYENWKVYPASNETIPDHTTHSSYGHYYGLDFKDVRSSSLRRRHVIQSRRLDGSKFRCIKFSYLLAKVLPATRLYYEIESRSETGAFPYLTKWQVAGGTAGLWFTHKVPLERRMFDFRMGIDTVGESDGKVFVDDVLFTQDSCDNPHNCNFEVRTKILTTRS